MLDRMKAMPDLSFGFLGTEEAPNGKGRPFSDIDQRWREAQRRWRMPTITDTRLKLEDHGAEWLRRAVADHSQALRSTLAHLPSDVAGIRIRGVTKLVPFLGSDGPIGAIATRILGAESRPVRALLFDKTAGANWSLAWHQDRTICVKERIEVDGFGPWTTKQGLQHVAPPFNLLSDMITLRVHLDDVPATNAPLLIAPGSHKRGRVLIGSIDEVVRECGTFTCLADAGDVWAYATPILHASNAAATPARRRVLQVDFATGELPGGLEWLGV